MARGEGMSRPKRMNRWYVSATGALWAPSLRRWVSLSEAAQMKCLMTSHAPAATRRQAERIAARAPDPTRVVVLLRSSRASRKYPLGYERRFTLGRTP